MHDPALILVVDDVAGNLDIPQRRLESQGYEVVTVTRRSQNPESCCPI
jgi:CheY-like chemotaxis protein